MKTNTYQNNKHLKINMLTNKFTKNIISLKVKLMIISSNLHHTAQALSKLNKIIQNLSNKIIMGKNYQLNKIQPHSQNHKLNILYLLSINKKNLLWVLRRKNNSLQYSKHQPTKIYKSLVNFLKKCLG